VSSKQSTNWFWSDWAGDKAVRDLTPAERGLWIDLLTLAAFGNPTGYVVDHRGEPLAVEQIARFANCSTSEAVILIDGILAKGVASRDRTGRLFNRRMLRDTELAVKRRRAGHAGGVATALKWHAQTGVPQHLPGHVPRTPGTRPSKKKDLTSTFDGSARESARARKNGATKNNQKQPTTAPQQSGSATEASGKSSAISPTDDLATVIQKKGWV
jgi:hypothetical protein